MANEVRIVRKIAAGVEEVYDAWTDPESVSQWMIPMRGGSTKCELDPRVGGRLHIEMTGDGETYLHDGEYVRLERPRLIEFSWVSAGTEGQRSIVRVDLRSIGDDETELTLTHQLLPSEEAAENHRQGWEVILDNLAGSIS